MYHCICTLSFLCSKHGSKYNLLERCSDDVPVQSRLIIELANYEVPRSENSTPPNRGIYFWGSGTRVKFLHTQFQLYVTDSFILAYTSTIFFLGYYLARYNVCMHA
jgi:hypothetical protein